jgi:GTP-binding protein
MSNDGRGRVRLEYRGSARGRIGFQREFMNACRGSGLQERGRLMTSHGDEVYEGQIIGIHSRDNDLVVNPIKGKKLTNVRAAGKDDAILLTPPIALTLEYAVEFIADDELVEITPKSIRIRKRFLKEHERKRASREAA